MSYQPIENYGIIGNMRTVALVGMNGSIDWYCYPHFDSPSIFGAILDDNKGGRFQICPVGDQVRHKQFYWPSTNILVTRFLLQDGIAELEDFMPVGLALRFTLVPPSLSPYSLRQRGVRISLICRPAFDYGRKSHETLVEANGVSFKSGSVEHRSFGRRAIQPGRTGRSGRRVHTGRGEVAGLHSKGPEHRKQCFLPASRKGSR